jgi:dTDP-4-amino-4,6-dideoxygalactose transaminase
VIQCDRRDQLKQWLDGINIQTVINYPLALPNCHAYGYLKQADTAFPNATKNQDRILSLPIFPEISLDTIQFIVKSITEF